MGSAAKGEGVRRRLSLRKEAQFMAMLLEEANAPVDTLDLGCRASKEMSDEERFAVLLLLFRHGSNMDLQMRFSVGDIYNDLTDDYGLRKRLVYGAFPGDAARAAQVYAQLRSYGATAKRWPQELRSDKYPWSYYKANAPGKPPKAAEDYSLPRKALAREAYFAGAGDQARHKNSEQAFEAWYAEHFVREERDAVPNS